MGCNARQLVTMCFITEKGVWSVGGMVGAWVVKPKVGESLGHFKIPDISSKFAPVCPVHFLTSWDFHQFTNALQNNGCGYVISSIWIFRHEQGRVSACSHEMRGSQWISFDIHLKYHTSAKLEASSGCSSPLLKVLKPSVNSIGNPHHVSKPHPVVPLDVNVCLVWSERYCFWPVGYSGCYWLSSYLAVCSSCSHPAAGKCIAIRPSTKQPKSVMEEKCKTKQSVSHHVIIILPHEQVQKHCSVSAIKNKLKLFIFCSSPV